MAITGASGLIGRALSEALRARGDEVLAISRSPQPGGAALRWHPERGLEPADGLSGCDAVVHLAGESVLGRWTAAKKAAIYDSRVAGTDTIVRALAEAWPRPAVFISASAVGYYGDRGDARLDEQSGAGTGFLAEVSRAWEARAEAVATLSDPPRLCIARIGVVMAREGGAFARLRRPFRLGLGGRIGDGRAWMPWIHLEDVVRGLLFLLDRSSCTGPYNLVAPAPVTLAAFADALAAALGRRARLPIPALAVRLRFGEMGPALLLVSQRVEPGRLLAAGFAFRHPAAGPALADLAAG